MTGPKSPPPQPTACPRCGIALPRNDPSAFCGACRHRLKPIRFGAWRDPYAHEQDMPHDEEDPACYPEGQGRLGWRDGS